MITQREIVEYIINDLKQIQADLIIKKAFLTEHDENMKNAKDFKTFMDSLFGSANAKVEYDGDIRFCEGKYEGYVCVLKAM